MVSNRALKLRGERKKKAEYKKNKINKLREIRGSLVKVSTSKRSSLVQTNTQRKNEIKRNNNDFMSQNIPQCSKFAITNSEYIKCSRSEIHCECFKYKSAYKYSRNREEALRRKISKLENIVKDREKHIKSLKQKCYRRNKVVETSAEKNVKHIIRQGKEAIKKRLLFCEVLEKQLVENKEKAVSRDDKTVYARITSGRVIKKFKLASKISSVVSFYQQRKNENSSSLNINRRMKSTSTQNIVKIFLEQDEHSALAPGKKDVLRKNGKTFRKRYLQDTVSNLFEKFRKETGIKMCKSKFTRLRPFWIVQSKISSRNTCMCKLHVNFELVLQKLRQLRIVKTSSCRTFTSMVTCDPTSKVCMYRDCSKCKNKKLIPSHNSTLETYYYQWVQKSITRKGSKNLTYNVKVTTKDLIPCTVNDLIDIINQRTAAYLKHVYDTGHQFKFFGNLKKELKKNEVFIVVDFSENYVCKYASEVQSVHFGASKKQISLHTGAFFYKHSGLNTVKCESFCSISECLRHDASAIWAHMQPVFELVNKFVPNVSRLHIQSDGPTTQYKNKTNFFLFSQHCKTKSIECASWNFSTAGHGKSVADGIGGTVKRLCDQAVTFGQDVTSPQCIVDYCTKKKSKVNVFIIKHEDIIQIDKLLPANIQPAPNSMKIHQLIWEKNQNHYLFLNHLSCHQCIDKPPCSHFGLYPSKYLPLTIKKEKGTRKIIPKKN